MSTGRISDLFDTFPFPLTEGQKNAAHLIESGRHCLILGSAGTGKSTLMEVVKKFYGDKAVFCATTGIANQRLFNMQGGLGTAAKVFGLPMNIATGKDWKEVSRNCQKILMSNDQIEHVIIEECGMLNAEQMHLIENRIKRANRKTKKRRERNIQIIMIGDLLQLGAVVNTQLKDYLQQNYNSHLFFKSEAFERMGFRTCFLGEVKRQNDKTFKAALDVLRYANEDRLDKCLQWLNKRYTGKVEGLPMLASTNATVDRENQKALDANPNPSGVFTASLEGDYDIKNCPVEEELELKVGLKVMTLVNDQEGHYQNGSLGEVVDMTLEGVFVKFAHTGEVHCIPPFEFEEQEMYQESVTWNALGEEIPVMGTRTKGKCTQIPIKQASAMSVHKSQGATINTSFGIDLGWTGLYTHEDRKDFGNSLAYVALSRATDIDHVNLVTEIKPEHVKVCEETVLWLMSVGAIDETKLSKRMIRKYKELYNVE